MDFLEFMSQWYKWIVGLPFAALIGAWSWRNRKVILDYGLFIWNLKESMDNLHRKSDQLDRRIQQCPNCDTRMKVLRTLHPKIGTDVWEYQCPNCRERFGYTYKAK